MESSAECTIVQNGKRSTRKTAAALEEPLSAREIAENENLMSGHSHRRTSRAKKIKVGEARSMLRFFFEPYMSTELEKAGSLPKTYDARVSHSAIFLHPERSNIYLSESSLFRECSPS